MARLRHVLSYIILISLFCSANTLALDFTFLLGTPMTQKVDSLSDLKFKDLVRPQYDPSCGSATLASILKHYFQSSTTEADILNKIISIRNQNPEGSRKPLSLLDLKYVAEDLGFMARGLRGDAQGLRALTVPVIVLLQFGNSSRFVIVRCVTHDQVLIGDPLKGNIALDIAKFQSNWNGILLTVEDKSIKGSPEEFIFPHAPNFKVIERLLSSSFPSVHSNPMEF